MMKKLLLLACCALAITASAQEKQKGFDFWVNVGSGKLNTSKHSNLIQFNTGLNAIIADKHYFGVHWNFGFSKGFLFNPDKIFFQSYKYINYGQRTRIRNWFYFTPSIGIGLANYSITKFYKEDSDYASSFISGLIFDATGKTTYAHYADQSLCIPINLQFDLTSRAAGLGIGLQMVIMKYPSIGISADLLLGKVHRRWKK